MSGSIFFNQKDLLGKCEAFLKIWGAKVTTWPNLCKKFSFGSIIQIYQVAIFVNQKHLMGQCEGPKVKVTTWLKVKLNNGKSLSQHDQNTVLEVMTEFAHYKGGFCKWRHPIDTSASSSFCSSMYSTPLSFQWIFLKFTPNIQWAMVQTPVHFCYPLDQFKDTKGPTSFFFSTGPSFEWICFKFTPNILLTKIYTPIHFHHSLVTFVATWEQNSFLALHII